MKITMRILSVMGVIGILGLLVGGAVLCRMNPMEAAGVAVSINAPAEVVKGSSFAVSVDISGVTAFDAGQFDVSFDESLVRLDDVTAGQIGETQIPVDLWNKIGTGTYRIIVNVPGVSGVSGSGSLAGLQFHAASSAVGTTALNLSSGFLSDNLGTQISATWTGDSITVYENPVITPPSVTTNAASGVVTTAATLNGNLSSLGSASSVTVSFEWGLTTSYGNTTTSQGRTATCTFSASLTGLTASVTYHFRAIAVGDGTTLGADRSFTTQAPPNNPPKAAINISPADGATGVVLMPILQSSAFSDPDASDIHAASQWQISTTSGDYSTPVFDSGANALNLTSMSVPSGVLNYSTTYYWHVRHQDNHRAWSQWSEETSFTTMPTSPTISSVSPAKGTQGRTLSVTITGTRFTGATAVDFGSDITVNTYTVKSSTRITAGITMDSDAVLGLRDVSVTIPGGATGTLIGGFTVVQARPTVSGVTPGQGARGQTLGVTITGTSFTGATAVSFGAGITVNSYTVVGSTQIIANITIDPTAKLGRRNVSVTTSAGTGTLRGGFVVVA